MNVVVGQSCFQSKIFLESCFQVCRIPTHLFMFLKYCKLVSSKTGFVENSSGWSRALRETVSNWLVLLVI